jgi:hypothetical protein
VTRDPSHVTGGSSDRHAMCKRLASERLGREVTRISRERLCWPILVGRFFDEFDEAVMRCVECA